MPPKDKSAKTSALQQAHDDAVTIVIKDKEGRTYRLRSDELGPADDLVCRQQTGFPTSHFLENFSGDTLLVVIWLARRKAGEANLPFQKILARYPSNKDLEALEVDIEGLDEDDDHPLADDDS